MTSLVSSDIAYYIYLLCKEKIFKVVDLSVTSVVFLRTDPNYAILVTLFKTRQLLSIFLAVYLPGYKIRKDDKQIGYLYLIFCQISFIFMFTFSNSMVPFFKISGWKLSILALY